VQVDGGNPDAQNVLLVTCLLGTFLIGHNIQSRDSSSRTSFASCHSQKFAPFFKSNLDCHFSIFATSHGPVGTCKMKNITPHLSCLTFLMGYGTLGLLTSIYSISRDIDGKGYMYHTGKSTKFDVCDVFMEKSRRHLELSKSTADFRKDNNLNVYPSRDGSKPFILCSYPKIGLFTMDYVATLLNFW